MVRTGLGQLLHLDEISWLHEHSPAWRLLCDDSAPLILSFIEKVFVEDNVRAISASALAGRLDDELYAAYERLGHGALRKPATAYLEDWAAPGAGWLRKFYPEGSDEPHFDATPAAEKALSWVRSLPSRDFVGMRARLDIMLDLLRQMVFGAQADPQARLAELRKRREELDAEIARTESGDFEVLEPPAQRDKYQQFATIARDLLSDFREVEENFRYLDRQLRERIAAWYGSKGELLDEMLGSRAAIADSDQGKSFRACYDFLLSSARQEELTDLLEQVHRLEAIGDADPRTSRVHFDLLDAGERVQSTVRQLSEQVRRSLDDQVWFENRRVISILRSIESRALKLCQEGEVGVTTEIDAAAPSLVLPLERSLYSPLARAAIDSTSVGPGRDGPDPTSLFEQVHVDPVRLCQGVRRSLQRRPQVGLAELIRAEPLQQGLAELVTYLSLTDETFRVVFDETVTDHLTWLDPDGQERSAALPRVTFARAAAGSPSLAPNGVTG
jgi:Protein of unknown function (DUF3375)